MSSSSHKYQGQYIIHDGDYLKIALPPEPKLLEDVSTRTAASQRHRGLSHGDINRIFIEGALDEATVDSARLPLRNSSNEEDERNLMQTSTPMFSRLEEDVNAILAPIRAEAEQAQQQARQFLEWQLPPAFHALRHLHEIAVVRNQHDLQGLGVLSWYISHTRARRCNLVEPTSLWFTYNGSLICCTHGEMKSTLNLKYELIVVHPQPYDLELGIVAHVILAQHRLDAEVAAEITLYDDALHQGRAHRFATALPQQVTHEHLISEANRDVVYYHLGAVCNSWCGWRDLTRAEAFDAYDGAAFTIVVQRGDAWQGHPNESLEIEDAWALQTHTQTLQLETLIPSPTAVVSLVAGSYDQQLSHYLEMPHNSTASEVQAELLNWGHRCQVHQFGQHGRPLREQGPVRPTGDLYPYQSNKDGWIGTYEIPASAWLRKSCCIPTTKLPHGLHFGPLWDSRCHTWQWGS